jgi:hypothetical protein
MRLPTIPASLFIPIAAALLLLPGAVSPAQAGEIKLQGFLLWGTDDTKPPAEKSYQPADAEIRRKLKDLPLKWTNWFEVKRVDFPVAQGATKEVALSEKCQVKVRQLDGSELEVALIGKGKEVVKRKQALPKGEILFLGGNAPNSTCWMVALKRIE